ncbi:MAG: hypothetical protein ACLTSZ_03075 [Lachnospiraceae bacterium]
MSEIKKEEQSDTMQTQKAFYAPCSLCPRACHVDRTAGQKGRCHVDAQIRVARAALHMWEEPCLSGRSGSGAVFFFLAASAFGCIFCQNQVASGKAGLVISRSRLSEIFLELQEKGTNNINLVTAGHYAARSSGTCVCEEPGARGSIVYNSSGCEKAEPWQLEGLIDIYLPDPEISDTGAGCSVFHAP